MKNKFTLILTIALLFAFSTLLLGADTRRLSNTGDLRMAHDVGYPAAATIDISVNPSTAETITIGADVYEWGGSGGNINVTIGGTATESRANLETAINNSGTENVLADDDGMLGATTVRIQAATVPGGTVVIGAGPSIVLSETMGAGANVWNMTNLNEVGSPAYAQMARGKIVIGAQMLLGNGTIYIEVPFTVGVVEWHAYTTAGVPKATSATLTTFLKVAGWVLTAGGTPLVATDYVVFTIYGE